MSKTILDIVIDLKAEPAVSLSPVRRTKKVGAIFINPDQVGTVEEYQTGTIPATAIPFKYGVEILEDAGVLTKIYGIKSNTNSPSAFTELRTLCFSVFAGDAVIADSEQELMTWGYSLDELPPQANLTRINKIEFASTFEDPLNEQALLGMAKLTAQVLTKFVNQNEFTNLQYTNISTDTTIDKIITKTQYADSLIERGYSFASKDETTVTNPVLMNLAANGKASVADIYIAEDLRQDIQVALFEYIQKNKPRYLNTEIASLINEAKKVIDIYRNRGLIESADFTIPTKDLQLEADIAVGKLSNVVLNIAQAGAIWRLKGNVQYDN